MQQAKVMVRHVLLWRLHNLAARGVKQCGSSAQLVCDEHFDYPATQCARNSLGFGHPCCDSDHQGNRSQRFKRDGNGTLEHLCVTEVPIDIKVPTTDLTDRSLATKHLEVILSYIAGAKEPRGFWIHPRSTYHSHLHMPHHLKGAVQGTLLQKPIAHESISNE